MMGVYPAASSKEIERAEKWIAELRKLKGVKVTEDWPAKMRKTGPDSSLTRAQRLKAARADLAGVVMADIFWLLRPRSDAPSTGAWVELGYALAVRDDEPRTIIVSGRGAFCIFDELADVVLDTDEDAFEYIRKLSNT